MLMVRHRVVAKCRVVPQPRAIKKKLRLSDVAPSFECAIVNSPEPTAQHCHDHGMSGFMHGVENVFPERHSVVEGR